MGLSYYVFVLWRSLIYRKNSDCKIRKQFPDMYVPSWNSFEGSYRRFCKICSLYPNYVNYCRFRNVLTWAMEEQISYTIVENSLASLRGVAWTTGVSTSTLNRFLLNSEFNDYYRRILMAILHFVTSFLYNQMCINGGFCGQANQLRTRWTIQLLECSLLRTWKTTCFWKKLSD